ELDEPWAVRERSILVRELDALPGSVRALIATLAPDVATEANVARPLLPNGG
ncbi:MAG TPA: LysR family transcriptional regulator, partial [Pseudomonas sp.]|nr:LysR family transcriptional regulator [Pseudomonas sp.]